MLRARMAGLASIAPLVVASLAAAQPPPPKLGIPGPFRDDSVIPASGGSLLKPPPATAPVPMDGRDEPLPVFDPKMLTSQEARRIAREAWEPLRRREYPRAIAACDEAIRLDPSCEPAYVGRGFARYNSWDIFGSLADFERAIELDPDDVDARGKRAAALVHAGAPWAALDACSETITRFPTEAAPLAARAWVRLQLRYAVAARSDAERALELKPGDAYATQIWMQALDHSGDHVAYRRALDEAIFRDPNNLEPHLLRAELLATSPDPGVRDAEVALYYLSQVVARLGGPAPEDRFRRVLRARAAARAALGDYPSSVADAWRALAATGYNPNGAPDLLLLATFLARRPHVRRPWSEDPPVRGAWALYLFARESSRNGTTLGIKLDGDCLAQASFLPAMPLPFITVGWNPRSDLAFGVKVRALLASRATAEGSAKR